MVAEISKKISRQASQHIVETNKVLAINYNHHSVEANDVVVSAISILETTAAILKYNYQC